MHDSSPTLPWAYRYSPLFFVCQGYPLYVPHGQILMKFPGSHSNSLHPTEISMWIPYSEHSKMSSHGLVFPTNSPIENTWFSQNPWVFPWVFPKQKCTSQLQFSRRFASDNATGSFLEYVRRRVRQHVTSNRSLQRFFFGVPSREVASWIGGSSMDKANISLEPFMMVYDG